MNKKTVPAARRGSKAKPLLVQKPARGAAKPARRATRRESLAAEHRSNVARRAQEMKGTLKSSYALCFEVLCKADSPERFSPAFVALCEQFADASVALRAIQLETLEIERLVAK